MQKIQKVESINIQSDSETRSKKRTVCLHAVEKYFANTQNDYETTSEKLTDKKKTNLFC